MAPGCGLDAASPFTDQPMCCEDGTSEASAFTAAVLAAVMSYDPSLGYVKAEDLLVQTASGGNLDVAAAFQADGLGAIVTAGNANTPQPPPTTTTTTPATTTPSATTPTSPTAPKAGSDQDVRRTRARGMASRADSRPADREARPRDGRSDASLQTPHAARRTTHQAAHAVVDDPHPPARERGRASDDGPQRAQRRDAGVPMRPGLLSGAIAAASGAALAIAVAGSPPAVATTTPGSYTINACSPSTSPGAWTSINQATASLTTSNACGGVPAIGPDDAETLAISTTGALFSEDQIGSTTPVPTGSQTGWALTVPAGIQITGISSYSSYETDGGWLSGLQVDGIPQSSDCQTNLDHTSPCAYYNDQLPQVQTGLDASSLFFGVECLQVEGGATTCAPAPFGSHDVEAALYSAQVTLERLGGPVVQDEDGPLWGSSVVSGHSPVDVQRDRPRWHPGRAGAERHGRSGAQSAAELHLYAGAGVPRASGWTSGDQHRRTRRWPPIGRAGAHERRWGRNGRAGSDDRGR